MEGQEASSHLSQFGKQTCSVPNSLTILFMLYRSRTFLLFNLFLRILNFKLVSCDSHSQL